MGVHLHFQEVNNCMLFRIVNKAIEKRNKHVCYSLLIVLHQLNKAIIWNTHICTQKKKTMSKFVHSMQTKLACIIC